MVATTRNGLVLPTVGGERDTWGTNLNDNNFTLLDASLDGWTTLTTTAGTVVLTATGAVANQARERVLFTSAARTSAVTIVIPTVEKWYFVANYGSGSNLFIGTSGGNTVTCAANAVTTVICNGAATSNAGQGSLDNITGPTAAYSFNGQRLTSLGTGTASTDATNLAQVGALIAGAITPTGGGAVRITVADTNPDYLSSKIITSGNIGATVSNAASNEKTLLTLVETFGYAINSYSGTLAAGSGVYSFRLPYSSFTMTEVPFAWLTSGSSSGAVQIQLRTTSGNLLSSPIQIDSGTNYSASSVAPPVISTSAITGYRQVFVDVNAAGTSSLGGVVHIIGRRS